MAFLFFIYGDLHFCPSLKHERLQFYPPKTNGFYNTIILIYKYINILVYYSFIKLIDFGFINLSNLVG